MAQSQRSFVELCSMLASYHCLQPASACGPHGVCLQVNSTGEGGRALCSGSSTTGAWCLQGCISSGGSAGAGGAPGSSGQFPELLPAEQGRGPLHPLSVQAGLFQKSCHEAVPTAGHRAACCLTALQAGESPALSHVESHIRCHDVG